MQVPVVLRLLISLAAVALPCILLSGGIFGSFLFTFSIPILWQVGIRGQRLNSLGLRQCSLRALIAGALSGCLMGLIVGLIVKWLGVTGRAFGQLHALRLAFGHWSVSFSFQNELGYRLLEASKSPIGVLVYLVFLILVIGLGEELFWRGFVQQKMNRFVTVSWAVAAASVAFAASHFYLFSVLDPWRGSLLLLLIGTGGAAWGYLLYLSKSIWPSAVSHGIAAFILWKYFFFA